ncbi:MAG: group III truncated hemoglobin [Paracoccus sp. (in: a-proteobacteria)]|uniref:group III truncated hemoglobin n=1 Tax=Paracoccus sp. TaxID=267 RepID=UPI0026DF7F4F|nr:group III truncated hemoglobin [Paracoccus sp. (in: a-proteobacteria)]MDO5613167.1 group III truncated hemoglobin [Paracoccus sp. (in: a-proteobacteria)]
MAHVRAMIPPRFDISPEQIDRVVAVFYAAIRRHEVLGPVFSRHVHDWPEHEARIAAFWRNAILFQRGYDGNPMRVHMAAGDVRAEHFTPWLALFDETLRRTLPPEPAAAWSALAHRIGAGLRMGVQDLRDRAPGPPVLR